MSDCWNCPDYGSVFCAGCRADSEPERVAAEDERGDYHRAIEAEYERTNSHIL